MPNPTQKIKFSLNMVADIFRILKEILDLLIKNQKTMEELKEYPLDENPAARLPKWKNQHNADKFPKRGEVNYSPSKTIPDQSMTIRELMDRHAKGLPLEGREKVPMYDADDPLPDIDKMDLIDKAEMLEEARNRTKDIAEKYKQEQTEKRQKRDWEELNKKFGKQPEEKVEKDEDINPVK